MRQGVSVRPGLPLCVCEGVLLFMVLPAINHVFPSAVGKTVREKMTVDGPMIHRNEEEEGEEEEISATAAKRSSLGSPPLSVPALFSLPCSLSPPQHMPAFSLTHTLLFFYTTGVFFFSCTAAGCSSRS